MSIPTHVLTDQFSEAIGDRKVNTAVFTTFNFDPGFFELHILPLCFPSQRFSEVDQVRVLQLDDNIRQLRHVGVYYDANALAQDAAPPQLGYERVAIHWPTGVFHPKLVLLLVEDSEQADRYSLIVGCQSANITQAGWWDNVECCHIEEIRDRRVDASPTSLRSELMTWLTRFRNAIRQENNAAINVIYEFIRDHTRSPSANEQPNEGSLTPRLFGGSRNWDFATWLTDEVGIPPDMNLEVVSPYFDKSHAAALTRLIEITQPRQTRVYLPQKSDGAALVTDSVYESVDSMRSVSWARLPKDYLRRKGSGAGDQGTPRFVHAKQYRFWKNSIGDLVVIGSVNCTRSAHSSSNSGNLEANIVVDGAKQGLHRRWWLEIEDETPTGFIDKVPDQSDGNDRASFEIVVLYDWARHEVRVRMNGNLRFPVRFHDSVGGELFVVREYTPPDWASYGKSAADRVRETLEKSSLINAECAEGSWRLLIREESCSHRPSLLSKLTPEEILKYWSLLSPEQRTRFLETRLVGKMEGLPTTKAEPHVDPHSVFHQFSGIFHAFGHLRRHIEASLEANLLDDAEYRLLGAKYDSLPELLRKMDEAEDQDPLMVYVTFLTAKQLRNRIALKYPSFVSERQEMLDVLDRLIARGLQKRELIEFPESGEREKFLDWFEPHFLNEHSA